MKTKCGITSHILTYFTYIVSVKSLEHTFSFNVFFFIFIIFNIVD